MTEREKLYGPPGTGKTRRLEEEAKKYLDGGGDPTHLAFLSFTNAAVAEGRERFASRFGLASRDLPLVRTLHSLAFQVVRESEHHASRVVMDETHLGELSRVLGIALVDDRARGPLEADGPATLGAAYLAFHDLQRAAELTFEETYRRFHPPETVESDWSPRGIQAFLQRYGSFKQRNALIDFHDMIRLALDLPSPAIRWLLVDEAQDLTPVQRRLVEHWSSAADRVVLAGDDDQVVFGWAGADARVFLDSPGTETFLRQSQRVPRQIHALAQRIIARNRHRRAKAYAPRDEEGEIRRAVGWESALASVGSAESTLLLARNRLFVVGVARALRERGEPFESHGRLSPLDDTKMVSAARAIVDLATTGATSGEHFARLVDQVPRTALRKDATPTSRPAPAARVELRDAARTLVEAGR